MDVGDSRTIVFVDVGDSRTIVFVDVGDSRTIVFVDVGDSRNSVFVDVVSDVGESTKLCCVMDLSEPDLLFCFTATKR